MHPRTRADIIAEQKKLDMKLFLVNLKTGLRGQDCENDSEELDIYCKMIKLNRELVKLDHFL